MSAYLRGVAAWYRYGAGQPTLARYENFTNIFLKLGETVPNLSDADFVPIERMLAAASSIRLAQWAYQGRSWAV